MVVPLTKHSFMALLTAKRTNGNYGLTVTDATGNTMQIDIPTDQGGNGTGLRPMQILLAALMGCSNVDVVMILNKQKQEISNIEIEIDGHREPGKEPSLWQEVKVIFKIDGNVDEDKAFKAVKLSMDKYCSVAETLRKAGANIQFEVIVNGTLVQS